MTKFLILEAKRKKCFIYKCTYTPSVKELRITYREHGCARELEPWGSVGQHWGVVVSVGQVDEVLLLLLLLLVRGLRRVLRRRNRWLGVHSSQLVVSSCEKLWLILSKSCNSQLCFYCLLEFFFLFFFLYTVIKITVNQNICQILKHLNLDMQKFYLNMAHFQGIADLDLLTLLELQIQTSHSCIQANRTNSKLHYM